MRSKERQATTQTELDQAIKDEVIPILSTDSKFNISAAKVVSSIPPVRRRPIFTTFRVAGKRFIAIPCNRNDVQILDDEGNNYGTWLEKDDFATRWRKHEADIVGRAYLEVFRGETTACDVV